jgi:hypothetical protein
MVLEAVAAALVGLAALVLVLQPLLSRRPRRSRPSEPVDPEETPRGIALAALKEIDFDRETGKLSEGDYQFLKAKYTQQALDALRSEEARPPPTLGSGSQPAALICRTCGPRPEPDAIYCSTCGLRLSPSLSTDSMHLRENSPRRHEGHEGHEGQFEIAN